MPKIRKLQIGDEKRLIPLFKTLAGEEVTIDSVALIADQNVICLVVENEEELIGFGSMIIYRVALDGEVARIEDVVIAENQQGRGFGKMLTLKLLEIAKERKIKKISLTTNPKRIAAHKLYESVGFIKLETDTFILSL